LTYSLFSLFEAELDEEDVYQDGDIITAFAHGNFDEADIVFNGGQDFGEYSNKNIEGLYIVGASGGAPGDVSNACPSGYYKDNERRFTIKPSTGTLLHAEHYILDVRMGCTFGMYNGKIDGRWSFSTGTNGTALNLDIDEYMFGAQSASGIGQMFQHMEFGNWKGHHDGTKTVLANIYAQSGQMEFVDCAFYSCFGQDMASAAQESTAVGVHLPKGTGCLVMKNCTIADIGFGVRDYSQLDDTDATFSPLAIGIDIEDDAGSKNRTLVGVLVGALGTELGSGQFPDTVAFSSPDGQSYATGTDISIGTTVAVNPTGGSVGKSHPWQPKLSGFNDGGPSAPAESAAWWAADVAAQSGYGGVCVDMRVGCSGNVLSPAEAGRRTDTWDGQRYKTSMLQGLISQTGIECFTPPADTDSGFGSSPGVTRNVSTAFHCNKVPSGPWRVKNVLGFPRAGRMLEEEGAGPNESVHRGGANQTTYGADGEARRVAYGWSLNGSYRHHVCKKSDYGAHQVWHYYDLNAGSLQGFADAPTGTGCGEDAFWVAESGDITTGATFNGNLTDECSWPIGWMLENVTGHMANSSQNIKWTGDGNNPAPLHINRCLLTSTGAGGGRTLIESQAFQGTGLGIIVHHSIITGVVSNTASANAVALEKCRAWRNVIAGVTVEGGAGIGIGMKDCIAANNTVYNVVGGGGSGIGIYYEEAFPSGWPSGSNVMRCSTKAGYPNTGVPSPCVSNIALGCDRPIVPSGEWGYNCATGIYRDTHNEAINNRGPYEVFHMPNIWYTTGCPTGVNHSIGGLTLKSGSPCVGAGFNWNYSGDPPPDDKNLRWSNSVGGQNGPLLGGQSWASNQGGTFVDSTARVLSSGCFHAFPDIDINSIYCHSGTGTTRPNFNLDDWDMGAIEGLAGEQWLIDNASFLPWTID